MRLVPRLAVPVIVLASLAAGCGGAQVAVEEVPGAPAELTVPGDAAGIAPAATADAEATATATETPGADAERVLDHSAGPGRRRGRRDDAADDAGGHRGRRSRRSERRGQRRHGPGAAARFERRAVRRLLRPEPRRVLSLLVRLRS